ncbi:MAG: hypothetical protein AAF561_12675 [Planctomycetota bacterium]
MAGYRSVNDQLLHETVRRLEDRIATQFPGAGLRQVAVELIEITRTARARSKDIGRPIWWIRAPAMLSVVGLFGVIVLEVFFIDKIGKLDTVGDFIQLLEPTLGSIFFLAAIAAFLLSLETRWKRRRALEAVHELRAMAHVVDMHQLTKDPTEKSFGETRAPPDDRPLTADELVRYLDFCSEMLSLIGKVAVLYVQRFPDDGAVRAVDEIEGLTNGLSRKIWQKITILQTTKPPA